ncbi:MAG: BREX-1 system phosphatase PglZ type A, partial [Oliverpabstia sp.]|nr:BREX-1 system phosphatase PglZ type A [Oliverpabstia sp.]
LAWYDEVKCYYEGILQVAKMQAFFLEHSAGFHTVEARKVWKEYTEDYYHMDTYYRQYHLAFGKSLTVGNDHLDDLFKQVTDKVEGLYTHWFLGELGNNWADACADELAQYGRVLEIPQQVDFYGQIKDEDNRIFVIISDAFRYEVAASLAEQLRRETQSKVALRACAGIFPTVTKFGMAALLPHKELTVEERSSGGLQILADGMSTEAGNRDKVLKTANRNSVALKYTDIAPMKRAERSALVKGMDVVYIYHDKVDEASHTSDSMVFPACDDAIEEIKNIVRIIRNEFSGTRVYITADHGFLYTYSPLSEDAKVDKTTPSEQDVEIDRRYLITRKGATPDYLLPVKFMDDRYDAFAPRASVRIKKKGGGLNFVHGGISLQEMVVPIIEYHYLRNDSKAYQRNKAKYDTKPVEVGLLSAGRKISNMIFSLNFYQKEAVGDNRSAANYLLYFVDSNGKQISDTAKIIADKTNENGQERTFRCSFNLKSLKYDNRASYYLVIADETGLQMPQKEEFQIDIAFAVDEFDFFS